MFEWLHFINFSHIAIEVLFYFTADLVTKQRLINSRSGRPKWTILMEGNAMLSILAFFIWLNHMPYTFFAMTFFSYLGAIYEMVNEDGGLRFYDWIFEYFHDLKQSYYNYFPFENKEICHMRFAYKDLGSRIPNRFGGDKNSQNINNKNSIGTNPIASYDPISPVEAYHSAFGGATIRPHQLYQPRGLVNEGNMCFFNCVIQVLARMDYLTVEFNKLWPYTEKMNGVLIELMKVFLMLNESSGPLQTTGLKKALYMGYLKLNQNGNCLIRLPGTGKQEEQDVAEFLTWLLSFLSKQLRHLEIAGVLRLSSNLYNDHVRLAIDCDITSLESIRSNRTFHLQRLHAFKLDYKNPRTNPHLGSIANLDWIDHILYADRGATFIEDIFEGQFLTVSVCTKHNKASVKTELFKILHLAMCNKEVTTIEECLMILTSEEQFTDANPHSRCPSCLDNPQNLASSPINSRVAPSVQSHFPSHILSPIPKLHQSPQLAALPMPAPTTFSRWTFISHLPNCVVIQLMRFQVVPGTSSSRQTMRLQHRVKCSLRLDLSPFTLTESKEKLTDYSLRAVILYQSPSNIASVEGHYKAVVKTGPTSWHLFDDEHVSDIKNVENYLRQPQVEENVYLLFYCKSG